MSSILEDKFGIKINFIHNSELDNFSDIEEINDLRAFVKNGEYINIDKASIAEPVTWTFTYDFSIYEIFRSWKLYEISKFNWRTSFLMKYQRIIQKLNLIY